MLHFTLTLITACLTKAMQNAPVVEEPNHDHQLNVAIIGAGPSGLLVAGLLEHQNEKTTNSSRATPHFKIDVFEKREKDAPQGQGWDIDSVGHAFLKQSGVDALRCCARPGSATMRIFRPDLDVPQMVATPPEFIKRWFGVGDPEVNRGALREQQLKALEDTDTQIHFDAKVAGLRIVEGGEGKVKVIGVNNETITEQSSSGYDLVIDASGIPTNLRKYRFEGEQDPMDKHYTGISVIYGMIDDLEASCDPELVRKLGQGTAFWIGDHTTGTGFNFVGFQRFGNRLEDRRTLYFHIMHADSVTSLSGDMGIPGASNPLDTKTAPQQLQNIKDILNSQLGPTFPKMFSECIQQGISSVFSRPCVRYPTDPVPLENEFPLVLVGDALHGLPVYSGASGNLALASAGKVAEFLSGWDWRQSRDALLRDLRQLEAKLLKNAENDAAMAKDVEHLFRGWSQRKDMLSDFQFSEIIRKRGLYDHDYIVPKDWTLSERLTAVPLWILHKMHEMENFGMDYKTKSG